MYHYWGEPLYGYYQSTDPWVIRRHARLLADAGVDTLIFDTTNTETYPDVYSRLCEVFLGIRKSGGRTPRIAFMMNTNAGETGRQVYRDLYAPGKFRDLWFVWRGKPLMICDPTQADAELREFFTLRRAHWPDRLVNTPYAWHWEATYPQCYGYTDDPGGAEQVNVSVAQNLRASDGRPTNMSVGNARGRSFHDGAADTAPGALDRGGNFQEQWKRAFDLDPPFAMVTGWNEWVAGRWGKPDSTVEFVDQFDREYSRDIEPMKGGHGDNYYYQLAANVRRYKGISAIPKASSPRSIDLDGGFESWKDVAPEFLDDAGDTSPRDHDGAGGTHYVNRSGRNDLVACKVARDDKTRLLLRPDAGRPDRPDRPELDGTSDRRRPRSPDGLGRLRLHHQPDRRSRWDNLAGTERRRMEVGEGREGPRPGLGDRAAVGHPSTRDRHPRRPRRPGDRLQVDRQRPASRRYPGLLRERRRRPGRSVQVSLHRRLRPPIGRA